MNIEGLGYFKINNGTTAPPTPFITVFNKQTAERVYSHWDPKEISLVLCINADQKTMKWCTNATESSKFYETGE